MRHNQKIMKDSHPLRAGYTFARFYLQSIALIMTATTCLSGTAQANGLTENRPWQFESPHDKLAKANVLDVIERKKGGFYDGFITYNTTNIGTQINCSNGSSTNANIADNRQAGAAPTSAPQNATSATASGNSSITQPNTPGLSSDNNDSIVTDQGNSGALNSEIYGTTVTSKLTDVDIGRTYQDLDNVQTNSGELSSQVADSIACAMDGATTSGSVESYVDGMSVGILN